VVEGVEVLGVARQEAPLASLRVVLGEQGELFAPVVADLTTAQGLATVEQRIGGRPVDILVNNAGGSADVKPVVELTIADWNEALTTNLLSAVQTTSLIVTGMVERGWGRIVHVSSIAAREPGHRMAAYAAAKAALLSYSKALSTSLARSGVLSSVVLPGLTVTDAMLGRVRELEAGGLDHDAAVACLVAGRPSATGRPMEAEEVAAAIVFLCSQRASAITGVALPVDGGTMLGSW
jgi:NAD(P)-dependent dehydrogenase (short-subunit alcohol dehydrogenase family)